MRLLVVEDEEKIAASLRRGLTEAGFEVEVVHRGDEALLLARTESFALILLDVALPHRDGWEILRQLREGGQGTPVIFLTARDAIEDRVHGLELGADDYLVKPFAFPELLARIRTVLRRRGADHPRLLLVADLELDLLRRRARRGGRTLELTPREFDLLAFFAEHQRMALSRVLLASEVWGMSMEGNSNAIDVAVRRLRSKVDEPFEEKLIHTVHGVGYVLETR